MTTVDRRLAQLREELAATVESVFPVGRHEVALLAGVEPTTVDTWRDRYPEFPEPRWTVGGHPAWAWADIHAWLTATGRTKEVTT